jgi:environmental stress-induced protein Ves
MQILRAADRLPMPWKNGGGETFEVAAFPPGSGLDAFDWRISMAKLRASGPFSRFPGVARLTAMLEGEVLLTVGEEDAVRLTPDSPALPYAGDMDTHGAVAAEALDLNVMTRRTACAARLTRHRSPRVLVPTSWMALIALDALDLRHAGGNDRLNRLDAALWNDGAEVRVEGPSDFWLVEILTIGG